MSRGGGGRYLNICRRMRGAGTVAMGSGIAGGGGGGKRCRQRMRDACRGHAHAGGGFKGSGIAGGIDQVMQAAGEMYKQGSRPRASGLGCRFFRRCRRRMRVQAEGMTAGLWAVVLQGRQFPSNLENLCSRFSRMTDCCGLFFAPCVCLAAFGAVS